MPYTPPSSRSPASSTPTSPDVSRRSSFHQPPTSSSRTILPRSASYLTKHRRTPSAPSAAPRQVTEPSPEATSEDLKGMLANTSVRQSPPPITGDRGMPSGAIISPPDSSDDDLPEVRGQDRGRKAEDLMALQAAIRQIPQDRSSSPSKDARSPPGSSADDLLVLSLKTSSISEGMPHSLSSSSLDALAAGCSRKFSHARSATEPNLQIMSPDTPLTGSEEDSDEDMLRKPQMVRKKSGELVRPALRPSRRRPSSMPGTPTFSKAVHFDSVEHVRHFLQVDRPLAVSAGSSPNENYDSDTEYPFAANDVPVVRSPPFEWEVVMHSYPLETATRRALPVQLERVWLSADQKCLIGSVAVANLAFQKSVTCRFTLDYWKTTSEVAAEYASQIRPVGGPVGRDRFNFTIKLSDLANLESKTLYFCIRYNVMGQEHWDNNGGLNFQADFRKKMLPQNGKKGVIGAASRPVNGLPKSNRRPNPPTGQRPKSLDGVEDFLGKPMLRFDPSIHDFLGESAPTSIRLKGTKSSSSLPSDNLPARLSAPSGQAFANRYDFTASLSAAKQDAKDRLSERSDGLYMKASKKTLPGSSDAPESAGSNTTTTSAKDVAVAPTAVSGTSSPSAGIESATYEELVSRYCFFHSKQSAGHRVDGADDAPKSNDSSSTPSYEGSPVQASNYNHFHSGTQHHSLHPMDSNPYFQHGAFAALGVSPSESPLQSIPASSVPGQAAERSSPPATSVSDYAHFAGTSSNEYPYQHFRGHFPFFGADAHSATAIRG